MADSQSIDLGSGKLGNVLSLVAVLMLGTGGAVGKGAYDELVDTLHESQLAQTRMAAQLETLAAAGEVRAANLLELEARVRRLELAEAARRP